MTEAFVIELNDAGIVVAHDGKVLASEPGFAFLDGRNLIVGREAKAKARLSPQAVSHRFWDTLDQDTLQGEGRWRRTPADVAFEQLTSLWQAAGAPDAPAVFLVPATFTRAQLGLILGMSRKAGIRVGGLVDSALAALTSVGEARQVIVIDLTLHRVVGSRFAVDQRVGRSATAEIDQFGLMDYQRRFAATLGDVCVRSTRYDPMHSAGSEQALYDELDVVLAQLHDAEQAQWRADAPGGELEVVVNRADMAASVAGLHAQVDGLIDDLVDPALGEPLVLISERLDFWPELGSTLAHNHGGVRVLPELAAVRGATLDLSTFVQSGESIGLITERPRRGLSLVSAQPEANVVKTTPASHILVDQQIYRIESEPFVVGTATTDGQWGHRASGNVKGVSRRHLEIQRDESRVLLRDLSTYGTWVNGRRVDGQISVSAGDVVRLGNPGIELRLVQEARAHGPA
ncbi:MAG: FHA domain-containing protein [Gammaproteobacteria bacterium]